MNKAQYKSLNRLQEENPSLGQTGNNFVYSTGTARVELKWDFSDELTHCLIDSDGKIR